MVIRLNILPPAEKKMSREANGEERREQKYAFVQ